MVDTNYVIQYYTRKFEEVDHACTRDYWRLIDYLFTVCAYKTGKILIQAGFEQG